MTDYFNKIGKPLYDTFVKTRWFNGVPFGGDQNNKEEYMERMIDLDRYNEKRSQILSELSISKLWDIINQQVKIGPTGIVYAMDVAAVLSILDSVRVENIQDELEKLKIIFEVVYLDKDK